MNDFLARAQENIDAVLHRNEEEFRQLPFTKWTNNFGTTFWDTSMQFLALFYGIPDWKELKRRKRDEILRRFVWAETNAVERWEATPSEEGANFDVWLKLKAASELYLDFFSPVVQVFRPHVAIVMNWKTPEKYWDRDFCWETLGYHLAYAMDPLFGTHVFWMAHPTSLSLDQIREPTFNAIRSKWESIVSAHNDNQPA
jgi:hypothetical protein